MNDDSLPVAYARAVGSRAVPISVTTEDFDYQVRYTPIITDEGLPGFRCERLGTGAVTYLLLNPSTSGEGAPDVFVYLSDSTDVGEGVPECFITPFK